MVPGRILILEDDPDVAWVYEQALREDGNTVTVCSSFEDCTGASSGVSRQMRY